MRMSHALTVSYAIKEETQRINPIALRVTLPPVDTHRMQDSKMEINSADWIVAIASDASKAINSPTYPATSNCDVTSRVADRTDSRWPVHPDRNLSVSANCRRSGGWLGTDCRKWVLVSVQVSSAICPQCAWQRLAIFLYSLPLGASCRPRDSHGGVLAHGNLSPATRRRRLYSTALTASRKESRY